METNALNLFKRILATPSPSGYETAVQDIVREYVAGFADRVSTDLHGNVVAARNPDAPLRVMLAGHCDQIGLIVQHIDDDGFLYVQPIGGWDPEVLIGQRMTVWTQAGAVPGVIARKPIHLLTEEERKQVPKMKDLWLDIGANDDEDARKAVRIGDAVTVELHYRELRNGKAAAAAMDDKAGLWVVLEALRRIDAQKLRCGVFAVSTVQEELGLRGARTSAFGVDPHVGVAVDVTHATDCPTVEKRGRGRRPPGQGAGDPPRPEHEPEGGRSARRRGRRARDRLSVGGLGEGHGHGRERDSDQPRRRGRRIDQHPEPLHAQSRGDDFLGRHRPGGRFLGPLRRGFAGGRRFDAVRGRRTNIEESRTLGFVGKVGLSGAISARSASEGP